VNRLSFARKHPSADQCKVDLICVALHQRNSVAEKDSKHGPHSNFLVGAGHTRVLREDPAGQPCPSEPGMEFADAMSPSRKRD
jgi:hypothetical protein